MRRVDPTATAAFVQVSSADDEASAELKEAWRLHRRAIHIIGHLPRKSFNFCSDYLTIGFLAVISGMEAFL